MKLKVIKLNLELIYYFFIVHMKYMFNGIKLISFLKYIKIFCIGIKNFVYVFIEMYDIIIFREV